MALLTAKADPLTTFGNIDTSSAATNTILASYSRKSSTKATLILESLSGPDYLVTITGSNLPASLTSGFPTGSISQLTLSPVVDSDNNLFSWDGQGTTVTILQLGIAISNGNVNNLLNLFLGGTDTLVAEYQDVNISDLAQLENLTLAGAAVTAIGNDAKNAISGNSLNNLIQCGAGDDVARGFDGNDTIHGGQGNDRLFGALLNDVLIGDEGNDLERGGNGRDSLTGGSGRDELWGDFGRNLFLANDDGEADVLVVKSDQLMFNQLLDKIDVDTSGANSKCDIIGAIDSFDRIIIQGASTADLSLQTGYNWIDINETKQTFSGTAIFASGKLEALYTGNALTLEQITALTTGDASALAVTNQIISYGTF